MISSHISWNGRHHQKKKIYTQLMLQRVWRKGNPPTTGLQGPQKCFMSFPRNAGPCAVSADPLHSWSRMEFWKLWTVLDWGRKSHPNLGIPARDFLPGVNSELGFPGDSEGKESTCRAGDLDLIPELGRSPGGGHGNPLQYSCLENPHRQRSPAGYSPPGRRESGMT